jgi:hypothetical protein
MDLDAQIDAARDSRCAVTVEFDLSNGPETIQRVPDRTRRLCQISGVRFRVVGITSRRTPGGALIFRLEQAPRRRV